MYTISSHNNITHTLDVEETALYSSYTPLQQYGLLYDNDEDDHMKDIGEQHLRHSKQVFDDMWHAFLTMRRPLTHREYCEYRDLFITILDLHQNIREENK